MESSNQMIKEENTQNRVFSENGDWAPQRIIKNRIAINVSI